MRNRTTLEKLNMAIGCLEMFSAMFSSVGCYMNEHRTEVPCYDEFIEANLVNTIQMLQEVETVLREEDTE